MRAFGSMMMVTLVGCGVFGNDEVDEEAAQVYVGEWEIAALQSQDQSEIEAPIDYGGDLAIDEQFDSELDMVFVDDGMAYEIAVSGPVAEADGDSIENDVEGIVGRVPVSGGTPEVFNFEGSQFCNANQNADIDVDNSNNNDQDIDDELVDQVNDDITINCIVVGLAFQNDGDIVFPVELLTQLAQ